MQHNLNLPNQYVVRVYTDPETADAESRRAATPDESVRDAMRRLGYLDE